MSQYFRFVLACVILCSAPLAVGCNDGDGSPAGGDAGPGGDAEVDASVPPVDCSVRNLSWSDPWVATTAGHERTVQVRLSKDANCDAGTRLVVSSADPAVATTGEQIVDIAEGTSEAEVVVTGVAAGHTTLTVTWHLVSGDRMATLDVYVSGGAIASCDGSASGTVSPGGEVKVASGGLAGAGVALQDGASRDDRYHVDPFDVQVDCAADQLPAGYMALGPAVQLAPGTLRFDREIPVTIPVDAALLPEGFGTSDIEVSYTGPGVAAPRIVPVASAHIEGDPDAGLLAFLTPRLGTYQAVARAAGPTVRDREYQFQGVAGVSMGSGGSGLVGLDNPDQFDLVAPLGGPVDWIYLLHYIRTYHLGGFCTETERQADPTGCAMGSDVSRTPVTTELFEHPQDFEHWWYQDMYDGQGGTFDRHEYIQIFRDLTYMYGNANTDHSDSATDWNVTPPGVPDSRRAMTDAERCADPVIIPACVGTAPDCAAGTGFIDDEYNPDGQYPVITFCDGAEVRIGGERDVGVWDPAGNNDYPLEVSLAVDINDNGVRDPGEPVIRDGLEPFDDTGLDGLFDAAEPGYDPVTNPDPNGDDYDFQFNPNGTEGNWVRDSVDGDPCTIEGEAFVDAGIDGVIGTNQLPDGFDAGEGNNCWDMARGTGRMFRFNPRSMVLSMDASTLHDVDVFNDGGVRDLFNFAVDQNHFSGAFAARGMNLRLYDGHDTLPTTSTTGFDPAQIDWNDVGKYVMVRYGDPDASEEQKVLGDGGHVGTVNQILHRLLSVMYWMSARWPDGDRGTAVDQVCSGCETQFTFDFTSSLGRSGPVGVVLPPGYFNDENADETYPIVYFMHGYGQEPADLVSFGFVFRDRMSNPNLPSHARLQKMILVFPDGRCRGDECLNGTFYADAPDGNTTSPKMETWVMELTQYMRDNYRVKAPATFEVRE